MKVNRAVLEVDVVPSQPILAMELARDWLLGSELARAKDHVIATLEEDMRSFVI